MSDNDMLKLMLDELRSWRATLATKEDIAILRNGIGVRFDAVHRDLDKIAEMFVADHADQIGEDERLDAMQDQIDKQGERIEAIAKHIGLAV